MYRRRALSVKNYLFRVEKILLVMALAAIMLFPPKAYCFTSWLDINVRNGQSNIFYMDQTAASASTETSGNYWFGPFSSSASASFDWSLGETKFKIAANSYPSFASAAVGIQDRIYPSGC